MNRLFYQSVDCTIRLFIARIFSWQKKKIALSATKPSTLKKIPKNGTSNAMDCNLNQNNC